MHRHGRRTFLTTLAASALASGVLPRRGMPRARAATGMRTKRVVLVSLGGGLRKREALGMAEGATLPNLFGTLPLIDGFGADAKGPAAIAPEYASPPLVLPATRTSPLFTEGTLLTNLRYAEGAPGHLQGQGCLVSGFYNNLENRADARLPVPTMFEHHRKATGNDATDTWYLSTLGGFYSALQAGDHEAHGAAHGALFLSPPAVISPIFPIITSGKRALDLNPLMPELPFVPDVAAERAAVARLRGLLDGNYPAFEADRKVFHASDAEVARVRDHLGQLFADPTYQALFPDSFGIGRQKDDGGLEGTPDALTIYHAERILDAFQPSLMVVTLLDVDACHADFNGYLQNQQLADALITHLWQFIQTHPDLKDETALFVLPEHGRHLYANGQGTDSLGRSGIDHGDGDDGDRDVFALALGPDFKKQGAIAPTGIAQAGRSSGSYETIDVVATALALLGHDAAYTKAITEQKARPGIVIEELFA